MKNVLQENDRLLTQALSVDIINIVVHDNVKSACMNVDVCERCVTIESELKKDFIKKDCYETLFQKYNTLEKHCISLEVHNQLKQEISQRNTLVSPESAPTFAELFETNDLKAQPQAKDTVILKLKEKLHSLNGDVNERKVKREVEEIETLNIELDNKVTKLVAENEHLKQIYKQLYDSIKSSRVRSKEQCDALINKVNLNSAEVFDLNASLQKKVLVITALKETISNLKGKKVVTEAVSLNLIDPELLKIDVAPLAPKLCKNRTAHTDYIRHTQEEAATLREIVKSERLLNPLNTSLDYASAAYTMQRHNSRHPFKPPSSSQPSPYRHTLPPSSSAATAAPPSQPPRQHRNHLHRIPLPPVTISSRCYHGQQPKTTTPSLHILDFGMVSTAIGAFCFDVYNTKGVFGLGYNRLGRVWISAENYKEVFGLAAVTLGVCLGEQKTYKGVFGLGQQRTVKAFGLTGKRLKPRLARLLRRVCRKDYLLGLPMVRRNVNLSLIMELKSNKDASVDTIMNLLRLDDVLAERLGLTESQPHVNQLMVHIHHSPDQRVVGASALSLSLEVSHSWVKKMRENIAKYVSALRGVFVPLSEPLSAAALEGTSGSTHDATTTLSTTSVFANTVLPISTDDYMVAHADG
nr:hypothetical protein [Tanacetum cinerariifolium]